MKFTRSLSTFAAVAIIALAAISCQKEPGEKTILPEELPGTFIYNGNTYGIRSVVLYELDNNSTQLWISETAGYTTVDEIENSVGELVITIPNSKMNGKQDSFEQEGGFVKYDDKQNSGWCTLSCQIDKENKNISFSFSSQSLKAADKAIEGRYSGPYTVYTEAELSNQWSYNRNAKDLVSAEFFKMEDGSPSRIILYDRDSKAVELNIPESKIGTTLLIGTSTSIPEGTSVLYDNGEEFKMKNSYGSILVIPGSDNDLEVSLKLTNEKGKTLCAEYNGAYISRLGNKTNRCIYDSGTKDYGYNGKFEIAGVTVSEGAAQYTFTFISKEVTGGAQYVDMNLIPTLTISKEAANKGYIDLCNTEHLWSFSYHNFQVDSNEENNEEKADAAEGSRILISRSADGRYELDLEISYPLTKYKEVPVLDENGQTIKIPVEKVDPVSGEVVTEYIDKTEIVPYEVPTSIDLHYSELK